MVKKAHIMLFSVLILLLSTTGCVKKELPSGIKTQHILTCEGYCAQQPHIMCVGHPEISGSYPDCACRFVCDGEENVMDIKPITTDETAANATAANNAKTPSYILDVPRVYSGAHMIINHSGEIEEEEQPSLCYLGAYAMLAIYDDPSLTFSDIVAYSGVGSMAGNNDFSGLDNNLKENSIMTASENLGYDYFLSTLAGGTESTMPHQYKFGNLAKEKRYFNDETGAYFHLKRMIDSKKPVIVHLDIYHVWDDFAKFSPFWANSWQKMHASHFMTVTGYDEDYVYLNDPTDPDLSKKNMPASVENFLKAWADGNHPAINGAKVGPYWMVYINNNGKRKSPIEVIGWNHRMSMDAYSVISKADEADMMGELAVGRREFSRFLEKNGYTKAAAAYGEIADFYFTDPSVGDLKAKAYLEGEARKLLLK